MENFNGIPHAVANYIKALEKRIEALEKLAKAKQQKVQEQSK